VPQGIVCPATMAPGEGRGGDEWGTPLTALHGILSVAIVGCMAVFTLGGVVLLGLFRHRHGRALAEAQEEAEAEASGGVIPVDGLSSQTLASSLGYFALMWPVRVSLVVAGDVWLLAGLLGRIQPVIWGEAEGGALAQDADSVRVRCMAHTLFTQGVGEPWFCLLALFMAQVAVSSGAREFSRDSGAEGEEMPNTMPPDASAAIAKAGGEGSHADAVGSDMVVVEGIGGGGPLGGHVEHDGSVRGKSAAEDDPHMGDLLRYLAEPRRALDGSEVASGSGAVGGERELLERRGWWEDQPSREVWVLHVLAQAPVTLTRLLSLPGACASLLALKLDRWRGRKAYLTHEGHGGGGEGGDNSCATTLVDWTYILAIAVRWSGPVGLVVVGCIVADYAAAGAAGGVASWLTSSNERGRVCSTPLIPAIASGLFLAVFAFAYQVAMRDAAAVTLNRTHETRIFFLRTALAVGCAATVISRIGAAALAHPNLAEAHWALVTVSVVQLLQSGAALFCVTLALFFLVFVPTFEILTLYGALRAEMLAQRAEARAEGIAQVA